MKNVCLLLLACCLGAPLFAQDDKPKDPPKTTEKPQGEKDAEKTAEKKAEEDKMTEAGQKLFEDFERVWKKYYEIKLDSIKQNRQVNLDDDWNTAVKEAKNGTYKDFKEFDAAITAMQKADKVFARKFTETSNRLAKEHAAAVRKWVDEQRGK
ncbi:MAG: hypothetical protein DCC64_10725 [Planctomycetota bacterium]|nr:MAG: hypothetical protein DCC64_10725 [Planctomycetota bacterium]